MKGSPSSPKNYNDGALGTLMKKYTANPDFKGFSAMQTLASTNKELWTIWKSALPSIKEKLPKHASSFMFTIETDAPAHFIPADLATYTKSKRTYQSSWGQSVLTREQVAALSPEEATAYAQKSSRELYERSVKIMLQRIQIGDVFTVSQGTAAVTAEEAAAASGPMGRLTNFRVVYAVVDSPSNKASCVALVPRITVAVSRVAYTRVYFLPAECTRYVLGNGIVPFTATKPLQVPAITGENSKAPIEVPDTHFIGAPQNSEFFKYCQRIHSGANPPLRIFSAQESQLFTYQHPENPAIFFDVFGTTFYVKSPGAYAMEPAMIAGSPLRSARSSSAESDPRETPMSILMKHYTANPEFNSQAHMQTLASSNKELWKLWKDSVPSMREKLPKRGAAAMFTVLASPTQDAQYQGPPIAAANVCVYSNSLLRSLISESMTKETCLDIWGQEVLSVKHFSKLNQPEQIAYKLKSNQDRYARAVQRMVEQIQIGDVFKTSQIDECYAIVDEPSKNKDCVVRVPYITVGLPRSKFTRVYFLPVECTNYMISKKILPLSATAALSLPDITSENAKDLLVVPSVQYIEHRVHNPTPDTPFRKYCRDVYAIQDPDLKYMAGDVATLFAYQHPENPAVFFDIFGTTFYLNKPSKYKRGHVSQIRELRRSAS